MHRVDPVLVVGIPAYNRARVLPELLDSILMQQPLPAQVVLCEDVSPEREHIRTVCVEYRPRFAAAGITFTYHENERNCGFDRNLRNLFQHAVGDYLVIMGNDDRMAPGCLAAIATVARDARPGFISRAYAKIDVVGRTTGATQHERDDRLHSTGSADAGTIFHYCAFISGLGFDIARCRALHADTFDGSLYYQYYLALALGRISPVAYIAKPLIEARFGIAPDFGAALKEKAVHVPGGYSANARIAMWASLIRITEAVWPTDDGTQLRALRRTLDRRYYFHVAEMVSKRGRAELAKLCTGLRALGLMRHPIALAIHCVAMVCGQRAVMVFTAIRRSRGRL